MNSHQNLVRRLSGLKPIELVPPGAFDLVKQVQGDADPADMLLPDNIDVLSAPFDERVEHTVRALLAVVPLPDPTETVILL